MTRWYITLALALSFAAGIAQAQPVELKPADLAPIAGIPEAKPSDITPIPGYLAPSLGEGNPSLRPSPSNPYAGVTLPPQRGDAAYQGGGVVLEQDDNGVNRRVR